MAARVIIVTGASRGIGLAVSEYLLKPHSLCNLIVVARTKGPLQNLQEQNPGRVEVLAGDLGDLSLGQKAVDLAISTWGRLDGLVVNHGQLEPVERVIDADIEEWRKSFDLNVFSYIAMIKAAIPALRKSQGRIVLTSSGAASKATTSWGCYGASKAVLNHLAKTMAKEEPNISIFSIRPGVVDTEMQRTIASVHFGTMESTDADRFRAMKAEGKMLRPDQPGNVMARLVLHGPKELSGEFLNWDDDRFFGVFEKGYGAI